MSCAPTQYKEMPNGVAVLEAFVGIEDGPHRVRNASDEKPDQAAEGHLIHQRLENEDGHPPQQ